MQRGLLRGGLSEPWQRPVDRFERRERIANQRRIFFDVVQPVANAQRCRMPALMIDPVGNLFAGGCEARLAGVEQGEEGVMDSFSDMKHLRSLKRLSCNKKSAWREPSDQL